MRIETDETVGLPIISIYFFGHRLGNLKEPVVYVRRNYLDYDNQALKQKTPFIESLTHDSIIVQIPYLKGRTSNHLECLLNVFNQDCCMPDNDHLLEIDADVFTNDEHPILDCLLKTSIAPNIRRSMEIEDEIILDIENQDTAIIRKKQEIEQKRQ